MVLVKGPLELAIKTRKDPSSKAEEGPGAEGDGDSAEGLTGDAGRDADGRADTDGQQTDGRETAGGGVQESGFIASKGFTGSRPGYVFRAGELGQGYYRDTNAPAQ